MALLLAACSSGNAAKTATTTRVEAERRDARSWSDQARAAYSPLKLTGLQLPERVRAWAAGERSPDDLRADLDTAAREVASVQRLVEELPPFPRDDRVAPLYRSSSRLYVQYVTVLQAALAQPAGPLRDQVVLLARRVRLLADRVFDRGQVRINAMLHEAADPNVEIRLPPEVPDWVAESMAAGPPLDDPPPPAPTTPPLREDTRPTQPRAAWVVAVTAAPVPAAGDLAAAIDRSDQAALRDLARRFARVARDLGLVADPVGPHGREDAAQARLALLAYGEAARAAQARLPDVARGLTAIGDQVWAVPGLAHRP
jgi:hypothetical protein